MSTRWLLAAIAAASLTSTQTTMATPSGHNIAAGLMEVDMNGSPSAITVTVPFTINDFRLRSGSTVGSSHLQIGPDASDDGTTGILMSCPAENYKDYSGAIAGGGLSNVCSAAYVDGNNNWNIATFGVMGMKAGSNPRLNINTAGAWFPFTTWIGGWVKNSTNQNGGAMDTLTGSTLLTLDTNDSTKGWYIDQGSGQSIIDLRNLGISSLTDGVLLATGAKNETANYGLTSTNADGTWKIFINDDGSNGSSHEQDPIGFVFIPKTNTAIISGRFNGGAGIEMFSGNSPQFTVTTVSNGAWELKPIGKSATNSVLIVSPEGGRATDQDNYVSYITNNTQDGWIIQSHDCPLGGVEGIPATEAVCSFAIIPNGTPGFTMTPSNNVFTTESGGQGQFTVVLDTQPTADVTFTVTSSNPNEGTTDVSSLTFTSDNWATPQTVTVTGVDDNVPDGTVFYTIDFGQASSADPIYNGMQPPSVTVGNIDNDPGISVTPINGLYTTESGGQATFNVHLNTQPTDTVTLTLSSSNPNEGTVSPTQLVFDGSNWDQDQPVTVTGVDDLVADGDVAYTIITSAATSTDPNYGGYNPPDVTVINRDNDVAGLVVSTGLSSISVVEGHGTNYTVSLSSQPTQDITVSITSSDSAQGGSVSPSSLVFTPANWSNAQPVSVSAADDIAVDGTTDWFITNAVTSGDAAYLASVPVAVAMHTLDNEPTISIPTGTLLYGIGIGQMDIAGLATLSDPNTFDYTGTTLRVTLTNNASADDQLSVRNNGTGAGQIGVSGSTIIYGGTPIATFTAASGSTPLVVTFNGAATSDAVQATMQSVTFANSNPSTSTALRSASFVLSHADGGASSASTTIRMGLLRATEFQEGADHGYGPYAGEADIELRESNPNTTYPAGNTGGLFIDWPDAGVQDASQVLLKFGNIFGDGPGQIPSNAVVVQASLTFHVPSGGEGDGSPLYRMTQDWDATNSTWATFNGGGIVVGQQCRGSADSVWGLPDGTGNTSTNSAVISVLPDVLAWQSGAEANYGWVLPGWNGNLDGTSFSPSEDAIITNRPDLRILWLPAGVASNSFRQNVNGYTGAVDTQIHGSDPTNNTFGTVTNVSVDWTVNAATPGDQSQVLMRFDNIIGTGAGQIPPGSQVHAAVLDLISQANLAQGQGGTFHMMLIPWQDTDDWETLGGTGITNDDVMAVAANSATAGSPSLGSYAQGGYLSYELTADVAQWVSGAKPNYGWVILPYVNGGDGWSFGTAEADEFFRPQLRVYYTPASVQPTIKILNGGRTATTAFMNFTGAPNTTYNIVRSTTVHGTYSSIGTATTDGNGAGTFTDNAPPAGSAFYQVSQ